MNATTLSLLNAGLWIVIVILAFVMQVMPFLLVLTLVNISFGVSSSVALVLIPVVLFGMLTVACVYASRRTRGKLPAPLPVYRMDEGPKPLAGISAAMLPYSRHLRMRDR
jgi:hypothetical protein